MNCQWVCTALFGTRENQNHSTGYGDPSLAQVMYDQSSIPPSPVKLSGHSKCDIDTRWSRIYYTVGWQGWEETLFTNQEVRS